MNAINSKGLHRLIKNHGILLEHQTKDELVNYFSNKNPSSIRSQQVGLEITVPQIEESFEIDVYLDVISTYGEATYTRSVKKENIFGEPFFADEDKVIANSKIRSLIVAECKGHPQDGFLLCRIPSIERREHKKRDYKTKQFFFVPLANSSQVEEGWHEEGNIQIVDWAQFCKINEGKSKYKIQNKKLSEDQIVYQEDKGKFATAVEQTNRNILFLLNQVPSLLREQAQLRESHIVRPIPLIITNSQICAMVIDAEEVKFLTLPWVTFLNAGENFARTHGKKEEYFKYIYVVNFSFLHQFLDIFLSFDKDFSNFPDSGIQFLPGFQFQPDAKKKSTTRIKKKNP